MATRKNDVISHGRPTSRVRGSQPGSSSNSEGRPRYRTSPKGSVAQSGSKASRKLKARSSRATHSSEGCVDAGASRRRDDDSPSRTARERTNSVSSQSVSSAYPDKSVMARPHRQPRCSKAPANAWAKFQPFGHQSRRKKRKSRFIGVVGFHRLRHVQAKVSEFGAQGLASDAEQPSGLVLTTSGVCQDAAQQKSIQLAMCLGI